jgi:hypothetical protein
VLITARRLLRGRRDSDIRFKRGRRENFYVISCQLVYKGPVFCSVF